MAPKVIKGSVDVWCFGEDEVHYHYIITSWLETRGVLMMRSGLTRSNQTAELNTTLVWRLTNDPSEPSTYTSWATAPGGASITTGSGPAFTSFTTATDAAGSRFFQLAIMAANLETPTGLNLAQVEYVVETQGG